MTQPTMQTGGDAAGDTLRSEAPPRRLGRPLLLVLLLLALLSGLWSKGFWGAHGEARRSEVAREVLQDGHWLVPTLLGEPFITKPPLLYWSSALSMGAFGVSEGAARLPAVLASLLSLVACAGIAGAAVRERGGDPAQVRAAAERAGAAALSLPLLLGMGQNAETEALLLACTALSVWAYLRIPPGGSSREGLGARAGLALALALGFLVKGPLGWLFPLFGILAHEALALPGRRRLRLADAGLFVLSHALLVLPWFLAVLQRVPGALDVWLGESVARLADSGFEVHREPFWYYLPRLLALAPWVLLLPPPRGGGAAETGARLRWWPLLWLGLGVLFLSFAASKRAHYLLSLAPAVAVAAALRGSPGDRWGRFADRAVRTLALALPLLLALALGWLLVARRGAGGLATPLALVGALAAGAALWQQRRRWETTSLAALAFAATLLIAGQGLLPAIDAYRSPKSFYLEAAARLPAPAPVVNWLNDRYSASFYLGRPVAPVRSGEELPLKLPAGGHAICEAKNAAALAALPGQASLVFETRLRDPFQPSRERRWQLWSWQPPQRAESVR